MLPIIDAHLRRRRQEEARRGLRLQRKVLREQSEPFALPDDRFVELFRLTKNLVHELIAKVTPHIYEPSIGISVETKVFAALRFYATGCYQRSIGEDYHIGLSQTSIHRCIHEVTTIIDQTLSDTVIKFPRTLREFNRSKELFMRRFQFPGVIGAVDCTHIAILKPTVEEHNFINRKGFHSLNVQMICDSDLKILSVNANYPGSSHDSFIWRQSRIKDVLHNLYLEGQRGHWLIGDSGYPLEPYLMTPFINPPENSAESRYNFRHASARNCIERCFGLLKMRFRCILKERTARYRPQFVGRLVNVCSVLHNICSENNVPLPNEAEAEQDNLLHINNEGAVRQVQDRLLNEGRLVRQNIVNMYFQ